MQHDNLYQAEEKQINKTGQYGDTHTYKAKTGDCHKFKALSRLNLDFQPEIKSEILWDTETRLLSTWRTGSTAH